MGYYVLMKKMKYKNYGSSLVVVLLLLIIIILAGVFGWMVYKDHKTSSVTNVGKSSKSSSLAKSSNTSLSSSNSSSSSPANQYLTISQLGIKIPLSSGISDLYYSYFQNNNAPIVIFDTKSLVSTSPSCAITSNLSTTPDPFGRVNISSTPYPAQYVGSLDGQAGVLYAHVNGYYLYWLSAQSDCQQTTANGGQVSSTDSQLLSNQLTLIKTALQNAVPAN